MSARQSVPRIRRIRMKEGGADLRVMRAASAERRPAVERAIRSILDGLEADGTGPGHELAGFAIVAWNAKGLSWADIAAYDCSRIPPSLIPDFVRNRLLAERFDYWTEDVLRRHGLIR